ncbi:hypothetical protein FOA52_004081 [Chlamydomonas sp. UWO 241]|nr:hypothetical protein FOA52_004081 [Chlamydomonas sp. UWO 241]
MLGQQPMQPTHASAGQQQQAARWQQRQQQQQQQQQQQAPTTPHMLGQQPMRQPLPVPLTPAGRGQQAQQGQQKHAPPTRAAWDDMMARKAHKSNPYEPLLVPELPDMAYIPSALRPFRDQCASGVRQAVAMVTAMESELQWERSRRQQAEEDCKVLIAAVELERAAADCGAGVQLSGTPPQAHSLIRPPGSAAANAASGGTKGFVAPAARKDFESSLQGAIRTAGVNAGRDPSLLAPVGASGHVSGVNSRVEAERRLESGGLRALLRDAPELQGGGLASSRAYVAATARRLSARPDPGKGEDGEASGLVDVLRDGYPVSSARVVAALTRRVRELQDEVDEANTRVEQADMSLNGLIQNSGCETVELSTVRTELEAERDSRARLQHTIVKLRTMMSAMEGGAPWGQQGQPGQLGQQGQQGQLGQQGQQGQQGPSPYVSVWRGRGLYGLQHEGKYPPQGLGSRNGVYLLDGPGADVQFWDDLRSGTPDPFFIAKHELAQHQALVAQQRALDEAGRVGPRRVTHDPVFKAYAATHAADGRYLAVPPPRPPTPIAFASKQQGAAYSGRLAAQGAVHAASVQYGNFAGQASVMPPPAHMGAQQQKQQQQQQQQHYGQQQQPQQLQQPMYGQQQQPMYGQQQQPMYTQQQQPAYSQAQQQPMHGPAKTQQQPVYSQQQLQQPMYGQAQPQQQPMFSQQQPVSSQQQPVSSQPVSSQLQQPMYNQTQMQQQPLYGQQQQPMYGQQPVYVPTPPNAAAPVLVPYDWEFGGGAGAATAARPRYY